MCDPVTLTVVAVSAAASAYGAYQTSAGAKDQAKFQSAMAKNNAIMAENQAQDASNRGGEEAARIAAQAARVRSRQIATAAGSGIDIQSNSVQSQLEDTDFLSEMDRATVRSNAARQAWGFRVEADNLNATSAMYSATAKAEKPLLAAGTSLLNSAASATPKGGFGGGAGSSPRLSSTSSTVGRTGVGLNTSGGAGAFRYA